MAKEDSRIKVVEFYYDDEFDDLPSMDDDDDALRGRPACHFCNGEGGSVVSGHPTRLRLCIACEGAGTEYPARNGNGDDDNNRW